MKSTRETAIALMHATNAGPTIFKVTCKYMGRWCPYLAVAFLADEAHEGRGDLQVDAAQRDACARLVEEQLGDAARVAHAQLPEHHDLVQPVEQLRAEVCLHPSPDSRPLQTLISWSSQSRCSTLL